MTSETCSTAHPELRTDHQLCFKLHAVSARFLGRWDRFLRSHGITYTEYIVLLAVLEHWPVGEMSLGERLEFDVRTLQDALVGLERRRLVNRSADHGMLGHCLVEPTPEGIARQAELRLLRGQFSCELGLTPTHATSLIKNLDALAEVLSGLDLDEAGTTVNTGARAEVALQEP